MESHISLHGDGFPHDYPIHFGVKAWFLVKARGRIGAGLMVKVRLSPQGMDISH